MKKQYTFTPEELVVTPFDISEHLDSEAMIAGYLAACLEDPDPNVFMAALGDVAKARGISQLAKATGLSRESLYKTIAPGRKPQFDTILKITRALGVPLTVPAQAQPSRATPIARSPRRTRQTVKA